MIFELLTSVSLLAFGLGLLVLILLATEVGWAIGRRAGTTMSDSGAEGIASAALGLLALLIAFTYSMALARYDLRRQVVLEVANAIGSTANFALMLPQSDQAAIFDALRGFTQVQLNLGVPYGEDRFQRDVAQANALQTILWQGAVAATNAAPQTLPVYRYVASLNEMNNLAEKRLTALRNHVPVVIILMLSGTAVIAMGFSGYAAGRGGANRRISMAIMSVLLAFLIVVTQDLARPDRGAIEVSTQALKDALAAIPPSPK